MRFLLLAILALALCLIGTRTASAQYDGFVLNPGETIVAVNGVPINTCVGGNCGQRVLGRGVIQSVRPGWIIPKPVPDAAPNARPAFRPIRNLFRSRSFWLK